MLPVVRQCGCRCLLQSEAVTSQVLTKRHYENPNTAVFKRTHELNRVGAGKFPLIKRRHYLLEKLPPNTDYKKTMKCILTKEVEGIGLMGTVVEVKKSLFRNTLYPRGDAVYASPENLEHYDEYRKDSVEEGIDYSIKMLMKKLASLHLPLFMNAGSGTIITKDHIRVALRKQGVWVGEDDIIPPKKDVAVRDESFTFKLQLANLLAVQVRASVIGVGEDGMPKTNVPQLWNNPPVDPRNEIQYLKAPGRQGRKEAGGHVDRVDDGSSKEESSTDTNNNETKPDDQ